MDQKLPRSQALKALLAVPVIAMSAGAIAEASQTDNKAQFKYQDKPGPRGANCAACRFFKKPNGCSIVHGKISPAGWCIAYAHK